MAIGLEQFHQTFFEECLEGLDAMETGLLRLEAGGAEADVINTIFRAAHSIKGGSATFGFAEVARFTHVLETLLNEMRDGRRTVTPAAIALLLRSVDCLRTMLVAVQQGETDALPCAAELQVGLEGMLVEDRSDVVGRSGLQTATSPSGDGSYRSATQTPPATPLCWTIVFRPQPHLFRTGNDPVRIFRELQGLGRLEVQIDTGTLPVFAELDPETCFLGWTLTLTGDVGRAQIEEAFAWVQDDAELEISEGRSDLQIANSEDKSGLQTANSPSGDGSYQAATQDAQPATSDADAMTGELIHERRKGDRRKEERRATGADTTSIRVGIDKVDAVINLVGELVITQSMLSACGENFDMHRLHKLQDGLVQLERNTRELQESVMRMRMLPISFAFNRFPRMVHDLSAQLDKKVELKISGEGTELDKTVIEKIVDPLVHLVRNGIDHGIEPPAARAAAGKPATGTLSLNAYHKGGNIVIEVADDGQGLNREKILAKAIARGLVRADAQLAPEQIDELVFLPGFSTADNVSDVSGRGVGMDVVRRNIQALGGTVEIFSEPGAGSRFTIRLPLTLAIMDGQSVAVGREYYIVPLVSIVESMQVRAGMVNQVAGRGELFRFREDYLPIIRLYDVFGAEPRTRALDQGLLVVVEGDGRKVGLFVDDLLGQQQVVVKSLETNYQRVEGISGATILGDGSVALILDVPGLIRVAAQGGADVVGRMH